jgi:hypothetical protein
VGDGGGDGSGEDGPPGRRLVFLAVFYLCASLSLSFLYLFVGGSPAPGDLRTAHLRRAEETCVTNFFAFVVCFRHISHWDDAFV